MVSDEVLIAVINQQSMQSMLNWYFWIAILLFMAWGISMVCKVPRSKKARQLVTDLYVIGTVRKLAAKDQINLDDEMKNLRRIEKLEKMSMRSLDNMVEDELKEKIQAENEKAIESIKNKKA